MSKERELLKELSTKDMVSYYYPELINRIKELLAQLETEQEPVAWMYDLEISTHPNRDKIYHYNELSIIAPEIRGQQDAVNVRPLYTYPTRREPLSDDVICDGLPQTRVHDYEIRTFIKGVKFAEKMHEIGGGE